MILAFVFGGVGFAVRILWIPAMVVMAVVFGLLQADRRASKRSYGVVAEIVGVVVHEAREVFQAASGGSAEDSESSKDPDEQSTGGSKSAPRDDGSSAKNVTKPKTLEPGSWGNHALSNGRSPVSDANAPHNAAEVTPSESNGSVRTEDGPDRIETEAARERPLKNEAVATEAVKTQAMEADSEESEIGKPLVAPVEESASAGQETAPLPNLFPGRLLISADRMVARNPLLRPIRKRVLGLATSLSQTIVQLATPPLDDPPR
jgi:hypothetical protein